MATLSCSRARNRLARVLARMLIGVVLMAQQAAARRRFQPPPPSPSWMSARDDGLLLKDSPRLLGPSAQQQLGSQMGADVGSASAWGYDELLEKRLDLLHDSGEPQRPYMDQPLGQVQKMFGADIDLIDAKATTFRVNLTADGLARWGELEETSGGCEPRGKNVQDPCDYVRLSGNCEYERFDYLAFHYCTVRDWQDKSSFVALFPVSEILLGGWLLLLFAFVGATADTFFAPAVAAIADRLQLSPDVAGCTLLAFGNGACDFFTQLAAIANAAEVDLPLALGESVGAAVYVCTACMAMVIFVSPHVLGVPAAVFSRDALAYLVAVCLTAKAIVDSTFQLREAITLIVWYVCYLSVVIYGDRLVPSVFGRLLPKEETCEQEETRRMIPLVETKLHGSELQLELGDTIDQSHHKQAVQVVPMDMWAWMNTKQWDPTAVVLALTMPPIEVLRVSRAQTALMAACGGAVMYVGFVMDFKHVSWADAKVMLLLGAAAASSAWLVSPVHGSRPRHSRLHLGMAFVLGITWMQILANEIVAVLEMAGNVCGLPKAFLGATVLAWGASAGDLASLMATARAGRGGMAVAACFATPLFQLLLGTGGSLAYVALTKGSVRFTVHSNLPAMLGFAIVLMLFHNLAVPFVFRYRLTRKLGWVLVALFGTYVALISCTGFGWLILV